METQASVLIVDDDPDLCGWLGGELKRQGYEVAIAHNCASARELLARQPFNLALIDYRLPTKDGLETLKELREVDPDLEAIVLTAYATVPNVVKSLRGGAYDFVSKPFTVRDLLPRLRAGIEKSELRGQVSLHEASRALIGGRSRADVASRVVQVARRLFNCEAGAVAYAGGDHADTGSLPEDAALPALARLLRSRPDASEPVRLGPSDWAGIEVPAGSGLLVPLAPGSPSAGRIVLLRALDLPPFTAADARRAVVFAAQVTLALENASLSEALQLQLREAHEARERLVQQEKLALTGQLAAGVAHELANPLSYVLTNLRAAEQLAARITSELPPGNAARPLVDEFAGATAEALGGVTRMQSFVRDLRVFARPGQEPPGHVDLRDCIRFATSLLNNRVTPRCRVETELAPVPLALVAKSRLEQVFVNLLANAIEAFPSDDPQHNLVRIATRVDGRHVVATISDNGPGIAPDVAPHVFEPFFTTKTAGAGSGLGLSLCRQILSSYGGTIELRPATTGTTFEVRLPVAGDTQQSGSGRPDTPAAALN